MHRRTVAVRPCLDRWIADRSIMRCAAVASRRPALGAHRAGTRPWSAASSIRSACRRASGVRATGGSSTRWRPARVVRSVAPGTVTFSGAVAGERYVVVRAGERLAAHLRAGRLDSAVDLGRLGAGGIGHRSRRTASSCSACASTVTTPIRRRTSGRRRAVDASCRSMAGRPDRRRRPHHGVPGCRDARAGSGGRIRACAQSS